MRIAVIGGDKRILFAARAFADEGHEVLVAGFDHLTSLCEIRVCEVEKAAHDCEIAVLPVRPVKDGFLFAPFSEKKQPIEEVLRQIGKKPLFSGCAELLEPYADTVSDYTKREEFALRNAELTAEGAIGILLNDYERAVKDTEILVTGYGRIGKMLSADLSALGAAVTVAARKATDRQKIARRGMIAVDYPWIDFERYRVIINTVPAMVIDKDAVNRMRSDVFLMDLASAPGGIDQQEALSRGLTCIHALSLPGKTAPLTAGIIIKNTIMNLLFEQGTASESGR